MTKSVLPDRHHTTDKMVAYVLSRIEQLVPRADLDALSENAVEHIRRIVRGHKTAFAWSGGKDSLVLAHLMQRAGVPLTGLCGITAGLEYPEMDEWYVKHAPEGVEIVRSPENVPWLIKHPQYLFSVLPAAGYWSQHVWLNPQNRYCEQYGKDMLILGRRRADGNYCGPGRTGLYEAMGVWRFLPIVGWTQEEVLAYLHYHHLELPPCYHWINGFKAGSHPWPARPSILDEEDGWAQVYTCDQQLVRDMAAYFPGARSYLEHPTLGKSYGKNTWFGRIWDEREPHGVSFHR